MSKHLLSLAIVVLSVPFIVIGVNLRLPRGCVPAVELTDRQRQFEHCRAVLSELEGFTVSQRELPDTDLWGHPLRLTVSRVEEPEYLSVVVRSAGPDGVFGTADDVVAGKYVRR